jgi:hypothetical protein
MKVQILENKQELARSGYETQYFAPFAYNIDGIADDASCEEILCTTLTDYVTVDKINDAIRYLVSKLAHKGKLVLGGTDLYSLTKALHNNHINIIEVNKILFAEHKQACLYISDLVSLMEKYGLQIVRKRVNGYQMIVEGVRE